MQRTSLIRADLNCDPRSVNIVLGQPNWQTINSIIKLATDSVFESSEAFTSANRVKYSLDTIQYVFPEFDRGKGPRRSNPKVSHIPFVAIGVSSPIGTYAYANAGMFPYGFDIQGMSVCRGRQFCVALGRRIVLGSWRAFFPYPSGLTLGRRALSTELT